MKDEEVENELFEAELRRLRPGRVPEDMLDRFATARYARKATEPAQAQRKSLMCSYRGWQLSLRRLMAPACCALALALAAAGWWVWHSRETPPGPRLEQSVANPTLNADDVEIDRQLLASFDAIASLPDGEPVRVRCNEWEDKVRFRDSARGLTVERRTPRLEVIPVRFETY